MKKAKSKTSKPSDNIDISTLSEGDLSLVQISDTELAKMRKDEEQKRLSKAKRDIQTIQKKRQESDLAPLTDDQVEELTHMVSEYLNVSKGGFYFTGRESSKTYDSAYNHGRHPLDSYYKSDFIHDAFDVAKEKLKSDINILKEDRDNAFDNVSLFKKKIKEAEEKRTSTTYEDQIFGDKDRIYYWVNQEPTGVTYQIIARILEDHNFSVTDYASGYAIMTKDHPDYKKGCEKNPIKIGKILRSIHKENGDDAFALQGKEYLYNYKASFNTILNAYETDTSRHRNILVLSRKTRDIQYMSTDRGWRSCMSSDGGWKNHLIGAVQCGAIVGYLIKNDDLDIKDPLARNTFQPYTANQIRKHFAWRVFNYADDCADYAPIAATLTRGFAAVTWPVSKAIHSITKATGMNKEVDLTNRIYIAPAVTAYGNMKESLNDACTLFFRKAFEQIDGPIIDYLKSGKYISSEKIKSAQSLPYGQRPYYDGASTLYRENLKI